MSSLRVNQIFEPALNHEYNYPAKWGSKRLEARDFEHLLGTDFVARYRQKEIEYTTEIKHRIYCICGTFVSGRPRRLNTRTKLPCPSCGKLVCTFCKGMASATEPHSCAKQRNRDAELDGQGPKKGADYDVESPCCGARILRIDGCSEMTCFCGKNFCIVCGKATVPDDGHWDRGGCPRFNQGELVYDDDDDDASDIVEHLDLANNPRHNGLVDELARDIIRHGILEGTIIGDQPVINTWIQEFRNDYIEANTEDELDEVERIIAQRVQAMILVAHEVKLFWKDEGFERLEPITSLQRAVIDILENLSTESPEDLEDGEILGGFGSAPSFELRHRRAQEAINSHALLVGQDRMENDYPKLLEFWRTYLEKIPAWRRTILQSDLGALALR